jgi:hypothetical protein
MLSKQEEEQERREVLENDRRVREQQQQQTGTFFSHGVSQALDTAGGRYSAAMGAPNVTGATPIPKYPAAAAHQADPVGTEPPLGFSVNELEPSMAPPVEATGDPADAPSSDGGPATSSGGLVSERAGSSPFQADQDADQ